MKFDFAAHKTVDSIDSVPQDFRGLYTEEGDGSYSLRSDDPGVQSAVAAITRMNGALNNARADLKKAGEADGVDLSPLSEFGDDPETIAGAVKSKLEELQTQLAASKGKKSADEVQATIERMKTDLMTEHEKQVKAKDQMLEGLRGQLHKHLVSDQATRAIVEAGGDPELLMPFVGPSLQPVEKDGKYSVAVVDENGETRFSGTTGEAMSIKERVAELRATEKFQKFFSSEAPNGGGANPNGRRSPQVPKGKEMSPTDKIKSGLSRGLAGKAGLDRVTGQHDRAGAGVHG